MTFSIITITFNSQKFLEETMQSVLSQEGADFEYIIVDGGSTDGTLDTIKEYATKYSRIRWISEPDNGIADAFNKGIRMSSGDIIGILNSDDCYAPGALKSVADAIAADPECDVFHGDMLRLQGTTPLFRLVPADVKTRIWREMPINHPATFITRRTYNRVGGFDAGLKIAMDYDLVLRIFKEGCRFCYVGQVLAHMRYGGASDFRFIDGLREVREVSIREGYPFWKAYGWFCYKVVKSTAKNILRKLGLFGVMRLHPRFRAPDSKSEGI